MRTADQNEILGTFLSLLEGPTGDGGVKRAAGLKPSWKVDTSHYRAANSHWCRWADGERVDADSGCHPLVHVAWRLLAVAWQEMRDDGGLPAEPPSGLAFTEGDEAAMSRSLPRRTFDVVGS